MAFVSSAAAQQGLGEGFLVPRSDGEIVVAIEAAPDASIVTIPVRHSEVGRLENDIRGTGLVNSDRVVIASGTPVYAAAFTQMRGDTIVGLLRGWCTPVVENNRPRGYCMFAQGRGAVLGILPSRDSLYVPRKLADYGLRPITVPQVRHDPSAGEALPDLHYRLTFVEWDQEDADLRQHVIVGGERYDLGPLSAPRGPDGAAMVSVYGVRLRLTPSPNGGALVERVSG
jgi:hypothetical protein